MENKNVDYEKRFIMRPMVKMKKHLKASYWGIASWQKI